MDDKMKNKLISAAKSMFSKTRDNDVEYRKQRINGILAQIDRRSNQGHKHLYLSSTPYTHLSETDKEILTAAGFKIEDQVRTGVWLNQQFTTTEPVISWE